MKPVSIDDVLSEANLLEAWEKVRGNRGAAGLDGQSINNFERHLASNLTLLEEEVRQGTYRQRPLMRVHIPKKSGGTRALSIPAVRDRVLQTAVALVLTPVFEEQFEDCSFAYRRGRSVQQAVARVERLRDEGYRWVVDADIYHFFDEIDHELLLERVAELVTDEGILNLIRHWLSPMVVDSDRHFQMKKGIAQGSPLSPLLANLFLDQLDDALLDRNLRLVRFADDFVVLCKKRDRAQDALELTADILESLKLALHDQKTHLVDFSKGFRFLGVNFIRSLAMKARYASDDTPETQEISQHTQKSVSPIDHNGAVTTVEAAFNEAGLSPKVFAGKYRRPEEIPAAEDESMPVRHDPLLRTLYLLEHGYVLGKESERLVVRKRGQIVREIPAIKVDQVMVFGNAQISTQAMHFCLAERIPIYLLTSTGRFCGVVDSFGTEPVLLHKDQFLRAADPVFTLNLAREFVRGKIANCRVVLRRYGRKRAAPAFDMAADKLKTVLRSLDSASTLDQLRGFEGHAAKLYFSALAQTLDSTWHFSGRRKRPPPDPVNAMLSYGYTLLFYNIYSLLRARGLNPHVGFLHPLRAGHPALVSDLVEEFRGIVVDTVVFSLVLNARLSPDCFTNPPNGGCLMSDDARGMVIRALESKLNASITHPVSHQKLDYRRCMEHQVRQLAAVIRGRQERYQAMVLK